MSKLLERLGLVVLLGSAAVVLAAGCGSSRGGGSAALVPYTADGYQFGSGDAVGGASDVGIVLDGSVLAKDTGTPTADAGAPSADAPIGADSSKPLPDGTVVLSGIAPGDLVVTEVMKNPRAVADKVGEWVEVTNVTDAPIALDGVVLRDAKTDQHIIKSGGTLVLPPGGAAVLGASGDEAANGGVKVDYVYQGFYLGNGIDQVILEAEGVVIDEVTYGGATTGWPELDGASMMLSPDHLTAVDNDDAASWCASSLPFGAGDLGTPGVANPACGTLPELDCGNGIDDDGDGAKDCDDSDCVDTAACAPPGVCGDGTLDAGEQCDDGNNVSGDGCEGDCTTPVVCGDGKLGGAEQCDDGNTKPGDGCSPLCKLEKPPAPGAVVVTEIMADPKAVADAKGEWFEVVNTSGAKLDMNGWTIEDGSSHTHVIDNGGPLIVLSGAAVVFGVNADVATNGGVSVDYAYKAISLTNSGGAVRLSFAGVEVDAVVYATPPFPTASGASLQLDNLSFDAALNDDAGAWCVSSSPFGAGDLGSPGLPNTVCKAGPKCGDGTLDAGEQCDDGNTTPGDGCSDACTKEVEPVPPGAIVITEIMPDPKAVSDTQGEWFEVANVTDTAIDLQGWLLTDGANEKHTINGTGGVVVPAKSSLVFGRNEDVATNGGVPVAYQYSGMNLSNGGDSIRLVSGGVVVDAVTWDGSFPLSAGASLSLSATHYDAADNDAAASWCLGTLPYGGGDLGSPGDPNAPCP